MPGRVLWALLAVLVASALVFGTGGFSAATIDRPVSVSVASSQSQTLISLWAPGTQGADVRADPPTYSEADLTD